VSTTHFKEERPLRLDNSGIRLDEVNLQERLEVQVRDLLAILDAEQLTELGVGDDAALEVGVKARVRLDVRRDELRYIRLGALGLGR